MKVVGMEPHEVEKLNQILRDWAKTMEKMAENEDDSIKQKELWDALWIKWQADFDRIQAKYIKQ